MAIGKACFISIPPTLNMAAFFHTTMKDNPWGWKPGNEDRYDDCDDDGQPKKGYPIPEAKTILDFRDKPPNPNDNLLGNRFLCRQGSMLFVAQSGIGKSSASMQMDILWSIGKPAFGIRPSKPLKILCIQAEDDEGDMHEFVNGIIDTLELTKEEVQLCSENLRFVSHKQLTGLSFLHELVGPLLDKLKPDLLRLNPFQAYFGADLNNPTETGKFLRNTLNPLLEKYNCGCIIVHHTPKTTYQNKEEWKTSDWMYSCTGCADLTNWARAILVIAATEDPNMFAWVAAKRGKRIDWADEDGNAACLRHYKHNDNGVIAWCDVDAIDVPEVKEKGNQGRFKAEYKEQDILDGMDFIEPRKVGALQVKVCETTGMSRASSMLCGR
jgi:hypothetical protein